MAEAICLRCGNAKSVPWKKCARCGYDPTSHHDDLVKSVYLSTGRFEDRRRKAEYAVELDRVARELERGKEIRFEEGELARLEAQKAQVERVRPAAAWGAVLRLFLPAIALALVLFGVAYLIRSFT